MTRKGKDFRVVQRSVRLFNFAGKSRAARRENLLVSNCFFVLVRKLQEIIECKEFLPECRTCRSLRCFVDAFQTQKA